MFVLLAAKKRQKDMMKDILSNVDFESSTLLHLAVDSGSIAVSTLPRILISSFLNFCD